MTRSVRIHEFGGPEVLKIEDVRTPDPVRLRVRAIGLNRTEATFRSGRSAKPALPSQIGFEAAGEVDAVGPGVTGVAVSDRVAVIPGRRMRDVALSAPKHFTLPRLDDAKASGCRFPGVSLQAAK